MASQTDTAEKSTTTSTMKASINKGRESDLASVFGTPVERMEVAELIKNLTDVEYYKPIIKRSIP